MNDDSFQAFTLYLARTLIGTPTRASRMLYGNRLAPTAPGASPG